MRTDFKPLTRNPHFLTIAGNFWKRNFDEARFPGSRKTYLISKSTTVLGIEHQPTEQACAQLVLIHGLEGSADAGYIRSFSQSALVKGFGVHRLNLRTCGGTETLSETMYHSGLTIDIEIVSKSIRDRFSCPVFVVGFSLGGNVALKLAGELGETDLLNGVCAISPPIDLARCVRAIEKPSNRIYARRFLQRLKARIRRKSAISPQAYPLEGLDSIRSIWDFDDRYTAPLFGFGTASNYYATQSSCHFLTDIRAPTLVITAKDDPLVPFSMFSHPAFTENPNLTLAATDHGGHLGFLARSRPRFWVERFALEWIENVLLRRTAGALCSNVRASA